MTKGWGRTGRDYGLQVKGSERRPRSRQAADCDPHLIAIDITFTSYIGKD